MLALYHYSTVLHLPFILHAGALEPSRADAHGGGHRGVLWFTTNSRLEATVAKKTLGAIRPPYLRWAVAAPSSLRWPAIGRAAGYGATTIRGLERAGRAMGGVPSEWWGQLGPLGLENARALELLYSGSWLPLDTRGLAVEEVAGRYGPMLRLTDHGERVVDVGRVRHESGEWAYLANTATARFDRLVDGARAINLAERALAS
jgi:hypothetical protein